MSSSVADLGGTQNVSAYAISKHVVIGIMRNLTLKLCPLKIRVNTINPSPVDNRMMWLLKEGFAPCHGDEAKKGFEQTIPLRRYAEQEEIAKLVLFLASDDSQFITGTKQVIDRGLTTQSKKNIMSEPKFLKPSTSLMLLKCFENYKVIFPHTI